MVRATIGGPEKQKAVRTFARNGLWAYGTPQVGYINNISESETYCNPFFEFREL